MFLPNDKRIAELRAELAMLETEKGKFEQLEEDKQLATILHDGLCRVNHTDACSWGYEKDWSGTRGVYLQKAQQLLKYFTTDQIKLFLNIIKGF